MELNRAPVSFEKVGSRILGNHESNKVACAIRVFLITVINFKKVITTLEKT